MQSKQASNIKSLSTRLRLRFGCREILQLGAIGAYSWTGCKGIGYAWRRLERLGGKAPFAELSTRLVRQPRALIRYPSPAPLARVSLAVRAARPNCMQIRQGARLGNDPIDP